MLRVTSSTSAPTRAHRSATEFAYDSFTARNALLAYFASSALSGVIDSVGASDPSTFRSTAT
jgi:hypothetical protein